LRLFCTSNRSRFKLVIGFFDLKTKANYYFVIYQQIGENREWKMENEDQLSFPEIDTRIIFIK